MISINNYHSLITSNTQLASLREQNSIGTFFKALKGFWNCAPLDDNQLMQLLQTFNRQPDNLSLGMLAGNWFASGYRNQFIDWCAPCGLAIHAFQDQYISHCQQQLLNQFVRPRLPLHALLAGTLPPVAPEPAGFIFHLSRCGSTLVSGCLAEIEGANVLSEPPAITELMLDANLAMPVKMAAVKQLLHAQYLAMPNQSQLIVKWNAWDLLHWQAIRAIWPDVPVVLLIREPVEILASHERQAGRHMAVDPAMEHIHPVFSSSRAGDENDDARFGLLVRRVGILRELLQQMQQAATGEKVMLVDYQELDAKKIEQIAHFFRMPFTTENAVRISARMQFHSKEPERKFQSDSLHKRASLDPRWRTYAGNKLDTIYQQLQESAARSRARLPAC